MLARLPVARPGPYHLRLSARSEASDVRGSVYVDVDVPDFSKAPLSLSGVVMNSALTSTPVAPPRVLRDLAPLAPTTERTFAASDIVTAFLRVYQGGRDKLAPVTMTAAIADAAGAGVFAKTDVLAGAAFGPERSAEYQLRLPLATLPAGEYLLTVGAAAGKITAKRDVRFERREP